MRRVLLRLLPTILIAGTVAGFAPPARAGSDPVLVGAGDITSCSSSGDEATAKLVQSTGGTVMAVGDLVYPSGSASQFSKCYNASWGAFKSRTRPAPGNHDYDSSSTAEPYFDYFGGAAGPRGKGWYSYDLGSWHVVVLNSNCSDVGCGKGSAQEKWLRADLAAHPATCTVAYFHHPLFSSSFTTSAVRPLWQALSDFKADVVVSGHAHNYERFAPQSPAGKADPNGIREFVVGTGGESHNSFNGVAPNSQVRNASTFGVLKLTLHPGSYDWKFTPVAGKSFTDSGTARCSA
ncbi:MAG TPA: metallophosphoesterase [Acidimicrobiia bacterium]